MVDISAEVKPIKERFMRYTNKERISMGKLRRSIEKKRGKKMDLAEFMDGFEVMGFGFNKKEK